MIACTLIYWIYLRFRTEHRGLVDVKGKGRLDTYWLVGKEGGLGKLNEIDYEYSAEEGPAYMKDISEIPVNFKVVSYFCTSLSILFLVEHYHKLYFVINFIVEKREKIVKCLKFSILSNTPIKGTLYIKQCPINCKQF